MQNTHDDTTPSQADRTVTHDEVIATALAEMANCTMADMLERVFGGRAPGRRPELALMITQGERH